MYVKFVFDRFKRQGMNINIKIQPIANMRYPTVGDYYFLPDGTLQFEIADTGNPLYNKMVLIHEMIEQALLEHRGLPMEAVDEFDLMFEKEREAHQHDLDDEPGFDNRSPYLQEHTVATAVEMMMCAKAGIKWNEYNDTIVNL